MEMFELDKKIEGRIEYKMLKSKQMNRYISYQVNRAKRALKMGNKELY